MIAIIDDVPGRVDISHPSASCTAQHHANPREAPARHHSVHIGSRVDLVPQLLEWRSRRIGAAALDALVDHRHVPPARQSSVEYDLPVARQHRHFFGRTRPRPDPAANAARDVERIRET